MLIKQERQENSHHVRGQQTTCLQWVNVPEEEFKIFLSTFYQQVLLCLAYSSFIFTKAHKDIIGEFS